jgi:hypothetical protein
MSTDLPKMVEAIQSRVDMLSVASPAAACQQGRAREREVRA